MTPKEHTERLRTRVYDPKSYEGLPALMDSGDVLMPKAFPITWLEEAFAVAITDERARIKPALAKLAEYLIHNGHADHGPTPAQGDCDMCYALRLARGEEK